MNKLDRIAVEATMKACLKNLERDLTAARQDNTDAAALVVDAGLAIGHGSTCTDLIIGILHDVRELRARLVELEALLSK